MMTKKAMRPELALTIQRLMLLIAAIGIDLGAVAAVLGSPSIWGSVALYAITVGLLAASLLGASLRSGTERASWLGIAIFGWLFLLPGIALTMREDPWTRAGVFLGAQVFGLIGGEVARLFATDGRAGGGRDTA
jgi:hypothetical protein